MLKVFRKHKYFDITSCDRAYSVISELEMEHNKVIQYLADLNIQDVKYAVYVNTSFWRTIGSPIFVMLNGNKLRIIPDDNIKLDTDYYKQYKTFLYLMPKRKTFWDKLKKITSLTK